MRLLCKVRLGSRLEPIKRRVRLGVMFFSFSEHNKKKNLKNNDFDYCFIEDNSGMAPRVLDHDGDDDDIVRGVRVVRNGRSAGLGRPGAALSARKGEGTPGSAHGRAGQHQTGEEVRGGKMIHLTTFLLYLCKYAHANIQSVFVFTYRHGRIGGRGGVPGSPPQNVFIYIFIFISPMYLYIEPSSILTT